MTMRVTLPLSRECESGRCCPDISGSSREGLRRPLINSDAVDAAPSSFQHAVALALAAGATSDEIVASLEAVTPVTGTARVVQCAPKVALALGAGSTSDAAILAVVALLANRVLADDPAVRDGRKAVAQPAGGTRRHDRRRGPVRNDRTDPSRAADLRGRAHRKRAGETGAKPRRPPGRRPRLPAKRGSNIQAGVRDMSPQSGSGLEATNRSRTQHICAVCGSQANWATDRSRPQHVLAPYKQEVACSSQAPPTSPLSQP